MSRQIGILAFFLLTALHAQALSVSLLGVGDNSQETSSNLKLGSQTNDGEGLLINAYLGGRWTASVGGLYFTRSWTDTSTGASNTISSQVLMVPLIFDFHLRYFSLGLGGYYSQNQGSLSESGAVTNSNLSYAAYGINNYDYGYLGRIGLHMPIGHSAAIQLGVLYAGGSPNLSINTANTFQNRDILYTAGITIGLGGGGGENEHQSHRQ